MMERAMAEIEAELGAEESDAELRTLTLDLFTEIAILEHLVRNREKDDDEGDGMDAARFGILNYFCRLGHDEARVSLLAWSFQEGEARIRELTGLLADSGYLSVSDEADPCIRVTAAGRDKHAEIIQRMAPAYVPVVSEIPREDLRVTVRTLMELRRTFDNLPDR